MSKFEELCAAFAEYSDAEDRYVKENQALALQIVNGLRDYLDAPKVYEVKVGNVTTFPHYIAFLDVDAEGNAKEQQVYYDALSHFTDGSFSFSFGVILQLPEKPSRKQRVVFDVECKRVGEMVQVAVSGNKMDCTFDGKVSSDIVKVHEFIFNRLIAILQSRPGDGKAHQPIGFDITSTK